MMAIRQAAEKNSRNASEVSLFDSFLVLTAPSGSSTDSCLVPNWTLDKMAAAALRWKVLIEPRKSLQASCTLKTLQTYAKESTTGQARGLPALSR